MRSTSFKTRNSLFRFVTILQKSEFQTFYKSGDQPKKFQLDSMYGLCFRCSLAFVVELVERSIDPADLKIDFVVESGHPNAGACKSITDRIVQGKHKRWTLYRVNEIGDKGKLLGTYQGRGHANKALKKIAYAPEPL